MPSPSFSSSSKSHAKGNAGSCLPPDLIVPLIIRVLELSGASRPLQYLRDLAGVPETDMLAVLHSMEEQDLIRQEERQVYRLGGKAWGTQAATALRQAASGSWPHYLGCLEESRWMKEIDGWLAYLDQKMSDGGPALCICLELTVAFFLQLGRALMVRPDPVQGRKYLESVMLVQMLCFSNRQHLEAATALSRLYYEISLGYRPEDLPVYMEMIRKITEFSLSRGSISTDLAHSLDTLTLPVRDGKSMEQNPFVSMLRHLFAGVTDINDPARKQLVSAVATGISHIAMHMRDFSTSEYIYSSLHGFDRENSPISLIWLSHYCFVLMRQGRFDAALEHLNLLFNCKDTRQDPLAFASAARGLAMYHFLHGRVAAAHHILDRETRRGIRLGLPHAFFLDPMNFDMLHVFACQGYAPIPRYELDRIIPEVLSRSSRLLQGAALRIQALRLRLRGAPPAEVISMLRESRDRLDPERDSRELILTLHELANTLSMAGDYAEARQTRRIVAAHAGRAIDPDTPYIRLALLATVAPGPGGVLSGSLEQAVSMDAGDTEHSSPHRLEEGAREPLPDFPLVGAGMLEVLQAAEQVADSNASVLILGETGVGKERVAAHIHAHSGRAGPLIAVHPASTSESLFESEFFGHERGAFTGATMQRKGFFEEADKGTLFIDELGDIPALFQTKLMRVLQEKCFRRVGGNRSVSSDFRLVSATNRDLGAAAREGCFRRDFLFRIAVVPLTVPPLRERRQDIAPLTTAYLDYFCRRYDRSLVPLGLSVMNLLREYAWPGNVRELRNLMERVVLQGRFDRDFLLGPGLDIGSDRQQVAHNPFAALPSLEALEKTYLSHVLTQTQGRVRGEQGAAALLGIKPSTLYAKLRRHGIRQVQAEVL